MIAEAGLAALWLAAALAALQRALACGLGGEAGRQISTVRAIAVAQGLLTLFALAALIMLFLRYETHGKTPEIGRQQGVILQGTAQ